MLASPPDRGPPFGVDSYHWSVTNEDYDLGAVYYEVGFNVLPPSRA